MDGFAQQYFHLSFGANGWAVWSMVFAVIIFGLTYFGIRISANASVILGTIEIGVFVVLAAWLIVTAGNGNTAATFSPSSSLEKGLGGWQGILHGMIFAFLAFVGFESSAPLAEEAHNPRRTVPRAILLAAVSIGVFYVFCSYAGVVGWGFNKISSYPNDYGANSNIAWPAGTYQFPLPHTGHRYHFYHDCRRHLYFVAGLCLWRGNGFRAPWNNHYYSHSDSLYGRMPGRTLLLPS